MTTVRAGGLLLVLLASMSLQAQRAGDAPDIIFVGGKVITVNGLEVAQAFAVRGDRFVAVGDSDRLRALAGPGTRTIDLEGHAVVPGLMDNHNHQYHVALLSLRGVDVSNARSVPEMLARLRQAAAARAGAIFTRTGWSPERLSERRAPTRKELDAVSQGNYILDSLAVLGVESSHVEEHH